MRDTMTPPLWRCSACGLKTRDTDVVRAHSTLPPHTILGAHRMHAPPTLEHDGLTLDDLGVAP